MGIQILLAFYPCIRYVQLLSGIFPSSIFDLHCLKLVVLAGVSEDLDPWGARFKRAGLGPGPILKNRKPAPSRPVLITNRSGPVPSILGPARPVPTPRLNGTKLTGGKVVETFFFLHILDVCSMEQYTNYSLNMEELKL